MLSVLLGAVTGAAWSHRPRRGDALPVVTAEALPPVPPGSMGLA